MMRYITSVREGTILPIAPLTQSTEERPSGPLTLRVYPGADCHGEVYQDDGKSFAFRSGQFFRQHFTCEITADHSLVVHVAAAQGSFVPWWHQLRVEVFGWTPVSKELITPAEKLPLQHSGGVWAATVQETSKAMDLRFQ